MGTSSAGNRIVEPGLRDEPNSGSFFSNHVEEQKDDDYHQHKAQTSRRIVPPAARVGPSGKGADQQDQDDEQEYHARLTARA